MKPLKIALLALCLLAFVPFGRTQLTFHQDIFNGGVTGDGFDPVNLNPPGTFDIYIEPGSTIRKAYLFSTLSKNIQTQLDFSFDDNREIIFNGTLIKLNNQVAFTSFNSLGPTLPFTLEKLFCFDVTQQIDPNQQSYSILPPQNQSLLESLFSVFYLWVSYENPNLGQVCANITLNTQNSETIVNYPYTNLNPINLTNDVGFAFNSWGLCDVFQDGSYVSVNNNVLGLVGGDEDYLTEPGCAGVRGAFYYQDSALYGLDNDVANTVMDSVDALANIASYITDPFNFDVKFEYQSSFSTTSNPVFELFLTYTSTCEPFNVSTPNDTTVCEGSQVPLQVTGGQQYEWLPATGLSCTDCPNPIFSADSSMNYTVRIWNNDTCSVVRPLQIKVRPKPVWSAVTTTPSECGINSGTATLSALLGVNSVLNYSVDGGAPQNANTFNGLSAGGHTFQFIDTNNCASKDTLILVSEVNNTVAQFTANPNTGGVPLNVQFNNTSTFASNYVWFINQEPQGSTFTETTFYDAGSNTISLVAWQYDPTCADTFLLTIIAYDSLVVQLPNVFTPNNDGENDAFTINTNIPVKCVIQFFNRWGNIIHQFDGDIPKGITPIWNGTDQTSQSLISDGTYFYTVSFTAHSSFSNAGNIPFPIVKSGFVQVIR